MLVIGRRGMSGDSVADAISGGAAASFTNTGSRTDPHYVSTATGQEFSTETMPKPWLGGGNTSLAQAIRGDAITIEGSKAPLIPPSWWPWIIGTVLLAAGWYFVEGRRKRGGASSDAPFVG